jgi:signal transduction histidine kinase
MNAQGKLPAVQRGDLLAYLARLRPTELHDDGAVGALAALFLARLTHALREGEPLAPLTVAELPAKVETPATTLFELRCTLRDRLEQADLWRGEVRAWVDGWFQASFANLERDGGQAAQLKRCADLQRVLAVPTSDAATVLGEVMNLANDERDWQGVAVLTGNSRGGEWQVAASNGVLAAFAGHPWPLPALVDEARRQKGGLLRAVEALRAGERAALERLPGNGSAGALLLVPFTSVVPGLLVVWRHHEEACSTVELALAETVAAEAAVAVSMSRLAEQVQRNDTAQKTFLSMLNHDLKSPLATIKAHADLLTRRVQKGKADLSTAEAKEDLVDRLTQISHRARDLGRQIDEVVDSSRLESGHLVLHRRRESLNKSLGLMLEEYGLQHEDRRIELNLPDEELHAEVDHHRMIQVLKILLNNALKYSDPDKVVAVRLGRAGDMARIEVQDWGVGMDPAEAETRLRVKMRRPLHEGGSEGLGLNLYIAAGLIALQDGHLSAKTAPGEGSTFTIELPLA